MKMKTLKITLATAVAAGLFVACANEKHDSKFVDVNGDGVADIEYKADNTIVDLDANDAIVVDGHVVKNTESNEEWDIVDEKALENSFDNVKADLKEFGKDVEDGAKKVGQDIEDGAKKVGEDIEDGAQKAGDAIEDGAQKTGDAVKDGVNKVGEGIKKVGEDIEKATDDKH